MLQVMPFRGGAIGVIDPYLRTTSPNEDIP